MGRAPARRYILGVGASAKTWVVLLISYGHAPCSSAARGHAVDLFIGAHDSFLLLSVGVPSCFPTQPVFRRRAAPVLPDTARTGVVLHTPVCDAVGVMVDFAFLNPAAQRNPGLLVAPTTTHLQQFPDSLTNRLSAFYCDIYLVGQPVGRRRAVDLLRCLGCPAPQCSQKSLVRQLGPRASSPLRL